MIQSGNTTLHPSEFSVSIDDIHAVEATNAKGELLRDTVGTKRKISLGFSALSGSKAQETLAVLGDGFFDVTYPDPLDGESTRCFYVSGRDIGMYHYDGADSTWQGLSFTLTER